MAAATRLVSFLYKHFMQVSGLLIKITVSFIHRHHGGFSIPGTHLNSNESDSLKISTLYLIWKKLF